jgi:hypothetical protein
MGGPAETYQETAVGVRSEVRFEEGEVRIVFHYFQFHYSRLAKIGRIRLHYPMSCRVCGCALRVFVGPLYPSTT